jgi:hypothetical protein
LRSKTSDLFKAVILNDFDIIVLLETSMVNSFNDEELFGDRYFVFMGLLIAVKCDFDVDVIPTRHGLRIEYECVRIKCSEYSYYISAV